MLQSQEETCYVIRIVKINVELIYFGCQSSVVCRVSLFGLFPVLVSVIMSSFLSSCVCLIIYDYPVYL